MRKLDMFKDGDDVRWTKKGKGFWEEVCRTKGKKMILREVQKGQSAHLEVNGSIIHNQDNPSKPATFSCTWFEKV